MRPALVSFAAAAGIAMVACSTPAPDVKPKPAAAAAASPPATGTPWNPSPDQMGVGIGDVSPQKLATSGNQIAAQIISVPYRIPHPENVTTAVLHLYVKEIGDIATMPVRPMENGVAHFAIEPGSHSLGPTVRFRASCPKGVTDWHTLGQMPFDYDTRMSDVFRIGSVSPDSVRWTPAMDGESGAGQRMTIWGPTLGAGCRIEAQVNGSDVELKSVIFWGPRYTALLLYRDINYRIIAPRYAELRLMRTCSKSYWRSCSSLNCATPCRLSTHGWRLSSCPPQNLLLCIASKPIDKMNWYFATNMASCQKESSADS